MVPGGPGRAAEVTAEAATPRLIRRGAEREA